MSGSPAPARNQARTSACPTRRNAREPPPARPPSTLTARHAFQVRNRNHAIITNTGTVRLVLHLQRRQILRRQAVVPASLSASWGADATLWEAVGLTAR